MSMRYEDFDSSLRDLAFSFFYWFSRFEFALKENLPLLKGRGKYKSADANWPEFSRRFKDNYSMNSALEDLLKSPPAWAAYVEELEERHEWKDLDFASCETDLDKAVLIVKTIRNNLFHGGKHSVNGWDDPARMQFLLRRGVVVLDSFCEVAGYEADYRRSY